MEEVSLRNGYRRNGEGKKQKKMRRIYCELMNMGIKCWLAGSHPNISVSISIGIDNSNIDITPS
jgi:hypothetical protein